MIEVSDVFPRYTRFDPQVPVYCVTPGEGRCLHRFFDTSPFSPSGRYLAVLRLPFEDRMPRPGDQAQIVLIDLKYGEEHIVYETAGFEPQLGANINWGETDHTLLFNDVDTKTWCCQLVKLDPFTGKRTLLPGGIYHASPCGRYVATANMTVMRRTQAGYGVLIPDDIVPQYVGARDDDGLWITDLKTETHTLLLPLRKAVQYIPEMKHERLEDWEIYGFHTKWNPKGDRLIFTIRRLHRKHGGQFNALRHVRFDVLTLRPDGEDIHNAVPAEQWAKEGHHINFFPDGENLSMNLRLHGDAMRLCQVRYDGTGLKTIHDNVLGSGHPTVHPNKRHILTDSYAWEEPISFGDGTVPIRWIDRHTGNEQTLVRIGARVDPEPDVALRIDPHPAWDRRWQWIAFNGELGDNTRRVFVADLRGVIG